jgi:hypothetical protein
LTLSSPSARRSIRQRAQQAASADGAAEAGDPDDHIQQQGCCPADAQQERIALQTSGLMRWLQLSEV